MQAAPRQAFDPYHTWLGIPPEEQPPNHYRLLGVGLFESQPNVIASAADRQMGHLRTFQSGKWSELCQRLLNEVATAKVCLLNPAKKATYDETLRQHTIPAEDATGDSTPWAAIAEQLPVLARERTGAKTATPARRVAGKWLTNLGPMIAVGATCVLLFVGLLAWNSTRRVNSPIGRTATAKAGKKQSTEQPIRRKPLEQPKADVRSAIGKGTIPSSSDENRDRPPVIPPAQNKPEPLNISSPPEKLPVVETPPAVEVQPVAPVTITPDVPEKAAVPVVEIPVDKQVVDEPQEAVKKRLPVPNDAVQQEIATQLAGIYGHAKTTEKLKLANQLLKAAGASKEPNEQYVLLRNVRDLACQGNDVVLMLQAVEAMTAQFDINGNEEKGKALLALAETANADQIRAIFSASQRVIAQAVSEGQYELASDLAKAVYRACQRSKEFRKKALDQRDWVAACCRRQEERVQAEAKLKADPNDAEAHLVLGRNYCFDDNWKDAMPHLAKGSDADLRQLAQRELALPTEPNEQIKLADAWWELAQAREGEERDSLMLRAGYWYDSAHGKLTSGIIRLKAEKRVEELKEVRQRRGGRHQDKDSSQDLWNDLF